MRKYFLILSIAFIGCLFAGTTLRAQVIRGRITDANGRAVSNASLFVRELKLGTTANDDGYYDLKVAEGTYTCVFQCLGYETETRMITVGTDITEHNIALHEKAYEIKEVVISNRREDPAYGIMRRAIAMAPYYMNQVSEFKADVYLKGTLRVDKIPGLIKRLAKEEDIDLKVGTYVEETFNDIEFTAPNKYRQKVLKKTCSMPDSQSDNSMTLITTSIYDSKMLEPVISPLSTSAFAHYRFRYEGFVEEDNRIINKIKITPARKSKQLLSGYIFIADNYWNVHSLDVTGEFDLIVGVKYRIQVNFGEVNENVWMPVSHRFDFDMSMLGGKGSYQYVSSVKYNNITENTSIRKPDALLLAEQQRKAMQQLQDPPLALTEKQEPTSKTSVKVEKMLEKENLSNREAYQLARLMQKEAEAEKKESKSMDITETLRDDYKITVDSTANQRDTAYWEMMRPVPLNPDELKSYQEKEIRLAALPQQKDTTKSKRSTKPKNPFLKASGKVLWGTGIDLGKKGGTLQYRGLRPSKLGFNTVDGFYVGQKLTWYKDFAKSQRENRLTIAPEVIWAINRKAVMWNVDASLTYSPMRRGMARLSFGQTTGDFSNFRNIYPFENTVSSLFFRRNYLKLYEDNFVEAFNLIDIANGLQLTATLKYARRVMRDNSSDYSFFYRDSREYTPNVPVNAELDALLPNHTSATFMLNLNYTPRYYYRIDRNSRKRYVRSDFPTIFATWQKGMNGLLGGDSNFDQLTLGIRQGIKSGLMQRFTYMVRGGAFINRESVFFPDFRHFNTVEIPVTMGIIQQSFNLLEYYRYSTSDKYLEAHAYYETPFLLLKFLPFFSNRMLWMEGAQLDYLYTDGITNYIELGYTIGGMMWKAGVFTGFENFRYRSFGVKLSLSVGAMINFQ